jgi:hypothetical protein
VDEDPLFLNNHLDPGGRKVDLVACTAKKKAERINLPLAENKPQTLSVFNCKCPAHPCAVTHKTLRTVDMTHLDTIDEARASLEIVLGDTDVHIPIDKRLQD